MQFFELVATVSAAAAISMLEQVFFREKKSLVLFSHAKTMVHKLLNRIIKKKKLNFEGWKI